MIVVAGLIHQLVTKGHNLVLAFCSYSIPDKSHQVILNYHFCWLVIQCQPYILWICYLLPLTIVLVISCLSLINYGIFSRQVAVRDLTLDGEDMNLCGSQGEVWGPGNCH